MNDLVYVMYNLKLKSRQIQKLLLYHLMTLNQMMNELLLGIVSLLVVT